MTDPLRNPKDPLHKTGPEAERELFRTMSVLASGFPNDVVMNGAINIMLNAIRQSCATRSAAERVFDDTFGRTKTILLDMHYDANGKRRNVFPYDQVLAPELFRVPNKF